VFIDGLKMSIMGKGSVGQDKPTISSNRAGKRAVKRMIVFNTTKMKTRQLLHISTGKQIARLNRNSSIAVTWNRLMKTRRMMEKATIEALLA
jgi:hypothetical protein